MAIRSRLNKLEAAVAKELPEFDFPDLPDADQTYDELVAAIAGGMPLPDYSVTVITLLRADKMVEDFVADVKQALANLRVQSESDVEFDELTRSVERRLAEIADD